MNQTQFQELLKELKAIKLILYEHYTNHNKQSTIDLNVFKKVIEEGEDWDDE